MAHGDGSVVRMIRAAKQSEQLIILVINNLVYSFRRMYMSNCLFLFSGLSHSIRKQLPYDHYSRSWHFCWCISENYNKKDCWPTHAWLRVILNSINFSSYLQRETAQMHKSEQWQLRIKYARKKEKGGQTHTCDQNCKKKKGLNFLLLVVLLPN